MRRCKGIDSRALLFEVSVSMCVWVCVHLSLFEPLLLRYFVPRQISYNNNYSSSFWSVLVRVCFRHFSPYFPFVSDSKHLIIFLLATACGRHSNLRKFLAKAHGPSIRPRVYLYAIIFDKRKTGPSLRCLRCDSVRMSVDQNAQNPTKRISRSKW